ncbi:MAG: pyruvate synthase subunit beta, partial [Firmicutes bacterium]|nr:pyruvate synthase subunit beta [Bacillota bacterium]
MTKEALSRAVNAKTLSNDEYFYGHKACAGCGESLAVRLALKVLGERAFSAVPPNCISTVGFIFPHMAFTHNALITPFSATGAILSGIEAGLRAQGIEDFYAVGFSGDGGTADIGIQALSGAIDRGDRII